MRMFIFAKRCAKEILRDPLNILFGLGFPVIILLLLNTIQSNVPVDLFEIESLSPGISVFGLSFITLFSATLIARDRESALLQKLYTTPLKAFDYIFGYMMPVVVIAFAQSIVCYMFSILIGLQFSIKILLAVVMMIPISLFYVSLGLLCGSLFNVKQVGGICGALLTNLSAWLSGIWFDLKLLGNTFGKIANLFPFVHCVELERSVISGNFSDVFVHIWTVVIYAVVTMFIAIIIFLRQMKK